MTERIESLKGYQNFLENKIVAAESYGVEIPNEAISGYCMPHQRDIVRWCVSGGRRAIFASFGLGKSIMQLEIAAQVIKITNKPFLIVMPLGVVGEFRRDNQKLGTGYDIQYITDTDSLDNYDLKIYVTNYERVRKGDIEAPKFGGVSFDEASILRNLKTETTNYVLKHFGEVNYRFVATATPTPNDFIEIINYADYLGVIDRGHALTRFFQRDSTKAGSLTLYPNKKEEFWKWVSTWAAFINKPSDYGYDDTGYLLPKLNLIEIEVDNSSDEVITNKDGDIVLFKDTTKSLVDTGREKRDSIDIRIEKTLEIVEQIVYSNQILHNENATGIEGLQPKILSGKPRPHQAKESQGLSIGQDQNRSGKAESLHDELSQNIQTQADYTGNARRNKSASSRAVCNRQRPSGSGKIEIESMASSQSGQKAQHATSFDLRDGSGNIQCDSGATGRGLRDLRVDGVCEKPNAAFCGSLPSDGQDQGNTLSSLQLRARSLQGQYSNFVQSGGVLEQLVIFCDHNAEQLLLEKLLNQVGISVASVTGSQSFALKEHLINDWKEEKYTVLLSKKKILGSGANLQQSCKMIFAGIDFKFNDFIQAVHREYRFGQTRPVSIYIILTQNEREVLKTLKTKWAKHIELQSEMINLVREYGLNTDKITQDMKRQIFKNRRSAVIGGATVYNEDTILLHNEMEDNSTDMILTSIPFGNHYEYSDNYNDLGHNETNEDFFKQMDFLTPNLLRTLKPGRVAAIHVKDRIRYSYQNGTQFTTIEDFSGQTVAHFTKEHTKQKAHETHRRINDLVEILKAFKKAENHPAFELIKNQISDLNIEKDRLWEDYKERFFLVGKITVTTDVVRENNQTYRLGHTEQCKDATKMGVGLPEYILIFRKKPTEMNNSYADQPVVKGRSEHDVYCTNCAKLLDQRKDLKDGNCKTCEKSDFKKPDELYQLANWQLDAHAYWKSSGDRFMSFEELASAEMKSVFNRWREHDQSTVYNFQKHLQVCDDLLAANKLSKLFMTIPPTSPTEWVWTDVNRMLTLNANQVNRKKEKHICPLQLDIIERLINRFTNVGDMIDDPFGGLFSTAYKALSMKRRAISAELNPEYYDDGLFYLKAIEYKINVPTLFDAIEI